MTKLQEKSPLVILIGWSLNIARYLEFTRPEKDPRLQDWHGKWEGPENVRAWKWATRDAREDFSSDKNGDKFNEGKRDYWWSRRTCILERRHRSFIVPNLNNPNEQESFTKNSSGWSNHVDMQQRCSLLDKRLKEIEGVNDLGSVDPRELCLVPDLVIPSNFKIPKFEKYDGTKCPETHLATYLSQNGSTRP